jgi:hypothetical protein
LCVGIVGAHRRPPRRGRRVHFVAVVSGVPAPVAFSDMN